MDEDRLEVETLPLAAVGDGLPFGVWAAGELEEGFRVRATRFDELGFYEVALHYATAAGRAFAIYQNHRDDPAPGFNRRHPGWREEVHGDDRLSIVEVPQGDVSLVVVRLVRAETALELQSDQIPVSRLVEIVTGLVPIP